ncbi:hypothetical protein I4U23_007287 [Adineta vaga]|nr:hypothetical protein I4U23_007287 [Adineta vaga]
MTTRYVDCCYILFILSTFNQLVQGNEVQLHSQFNSLSLSKELLSDSISVVYLQSILMIQHSQSIRMKLLQMNSALQKLFMDIYSTMYRIELAVKRVPSYIKTIFKLIRSGSSLMKERLLPATVNSISRIFNENAIFINRIIDQLTKISNLFEDIQQVPLDLSFQPSNRRILYFIMILIRKIRWKKFKYEFNRLNNDSNRLIN